MVESLASGPVQLGARATNGHHPAAAATINERIKRSAACTTNGPVSGGPTEGYIEIIEADPVGRRQLHVPPNAYTLHTADGRAYPPQLGAPLPAANDARVATLLSMGHVDQPPHPRIGAGAQTTPLSHWHKAQPKLAGARCLPPSTALFKHELSTRSQRATSH